MEDPLRSAQVTTSQPADDFPPADLTKIDDGTPTARPKQRIARIDGKMVVYHERAWWPAIFHRDLRAEKIAEAPPGMYAHLPACGKGELDVTSYWPDHHDWGFSRRTDRPDVLFEFFAREKQSVSYPGVMFWQGKIVVVSSSFHDAKSYADLQIGPRRDPDSQLAHPLLSQFTGRRGKIGSHVSRERQQDNEGGFQSQNATELSLEIWGAKGRGQGGRSRDASPTVS